MSGLDPEMSVTGVGGEHADDLSVAPAKIDAAPVLGAVSWTALRELIELLPVGVFITPVREPVLRAANARALEALGLSAREAIGTDTRRFWPTPADRNAFVRYVLGRGVVHDHEVELVRGDGRHIWVLVSVARLMLEGEELMVSAFKDIDERVRLLERVKASEERLRLLADNVRDVVWTMGCDGRFTYVSPSVQKLRGYAPEDIVGRSYWDALTPESAALVAREIERNDPDGNAGIALEQTCKDGSTVWTETTTNVLRDEGGEITGYVGVTRDITARKKAEDALHRLNAHFAVALEVTESASFEFSLPAEEVVSLSGIERVTGWKAEILPTCLEDLWGLVHPDDVAASREAWRSHLAGESPAFRTECRVRSTEGEPVWIELVGKVVDGEVHGRTARLVGVARNITERRRQDEERRQREETRHQEAHLEITGLLAAGVAHDFNNLLTGVMGHAELAGLQAAALPQATRHLDDIVVACRRASVQISQLLAYAGKAVVRFNTIIDPTALLDGLRPQIRALTPETVRFTVIAGDPPPPSIDGDESMLTLLLKNVITNAMEAVEPEGWVLVEMQGVDLDGTDAIGSTRRTLPAGHYLEIDVTDNGCGMDACVLARVFEPFFSTRFLGRGLGLPAARGIARAHRGDLVVRSVLGQGTTVTVWLPAWGEGSAVE